MRYSVPIIRQIIQDVLPEDCVITITPQGGDVDTVGLAISLPGKEDQILIKGFRLEGYYQGNYGETDPVEADMLEFRDTASDSRGGIQTTDEDLAVLAARLKIRLKNAGWNLADTLDPYF